MIKNNFYSTVLDLPIRLRDCNLRTVESTGWKKRVAYKIMPAATELAEKLFAMGLSTS